MARRPGRGRWQRVLDARSQARSALGQGQNRSDLFDRPPRRESKGCVSRWPVPVEPRPNESVHVVTLGEPATGLGVSRADVESMIAAGKIEALPTGYTRTIPVGEIERVAAGRRKL